MKKKPEKNILIAGYYGYGNVGDEAILSATLSGIRKEQPGVEFVVASYAPSETEAVHHVHSIHWKDIQALVNAAQECDLILLGGGGIFQDYWGVPNDTQLTSAHWGIAYYSSIALLSVLFNKPLMIHSVGVGPLFTGEGKLWTRRIFELADTATVRDPQSRDVLQSIGVRVDKIRIVPDPALVLLSHRDYAPELFRSAGIRLEEQSLLGVCIRNWGAGSESLSWKKELAEALDQFLAAQDASVVFIPFQTSSHTLEDDRSAAKGVISLMQNQKRAFLLPGVASPDVVKGIVSCCRAVVGMRLHSLIFAAGAELPMIALSYDPKVSNFMASLKLSEYSLEIRNLTRGQLFNTIDHVWNQPHAVQQILSVQIPEMKKRVQKNLNANMKFLQRTSARRVNPLGNDLIRDLALNQTLDLARKDAQIQSSAAYKLKAFLNRSPLRFSERYLKARSVFLPSGGRRETLLKRLVNYPGRLFQRVRAAIQRHGVWRALPLALWVVRTQSVRAAKKILFRREYERRLQYIESRIASHQGFFDFFPASMGWDTLLFQRFQHFSLQSARLGGLALYGGHPGIEKDLYVYKEVFPNLIVFEATDRKIRQRIFKALEKSSQTRIMRIESVDLGTTLEEITEVQQKGFMVVYEYIDELSPEITGNVPEMMRLRHKELLKNEKVFVVTTSDQLYENVKRYRSRNFILSTNGVDLEHWRIPKEDAPPDLKPLLDGRIIVGYHGALAKWIDYDLLRMIANHGRYRLLLIGHEHDDSFMKSGLKDHPGVSFLGGKSYFELNRYALYYDVAIMPFKKTSLTDAVSPVKIFEYMAAGKPVITTDLHECRKYRSCLVAEDHQEFMSLLQRAQELKNKPAYLKLLKKEAEDNSWEEKTRDLLRLVGMSV